MSETADIEVEQGDEALGRIVRIGLLIDLYGGLLTDRQRTFIQAHYEEDLSFGEIARTHGVSRQAVHDAVKHAEAALDEYESKLRLLERGVVKSAGAVAAQATRETPQVREQDTAGGAPAAPSAQIAEAVAKLKELRDRIRRSGGVIYNADGIAREIEEVANSLEQASN